ncbi:MAG: ABC transporter ATP-binding protein [Polyangiaceae bacterium]|nr:ABC transporter ATP-binding protein [Polyangiaceae bacterium]
MSNTENGDETVLSVKNLEVAFPVRRGFLQRQVGTVRAVSGVTFDVAKASTLGLVGESGCGKSTTARAILRLIQPSGGKVEICGTDVTHLSERELFPVRAKAQMVFQDPYASLNPRMTVLETLREPLRVHKIVAGKSAETDEVVRLLGMVGLDPSAMRSYPHEMSGGQRQRVGIARALSVRPKLVLLDEPVSALDVSIQAQIVNLLSELQDELNLSYVFVAHDLSVVRHISTEVAVMYLGRIVERAPVERLFEAPIHPYTRALLSAVPMADPVAAKERKRLPVLGEVPSAQYPPSGCAFHPRCAAKRSRCETERPDLTDRGNGRSAACFLEGG